MNHAWVRACILAEAVGMTAAAAAARLGTWLADERAAPGWLVLGIVVAGGLVEGGALGVLQARVLRHDVGRAGARAWALATLAVAGLGWAAASAPATLSPDDGGSTPPLVLVLCGAAALGAAMGAVLGAAQAGAVRHAPRRPRRWIRASTLGWAVAMPAIFLGATIVPAGWPAWVVTAVGTATGIAAGSVLGVLTARAALPVPRGPKVPSGREVRPWAPTSAGS
ncbi:MAG TPA: hypothetical protein VNS81_02135 [Nocardioides sp.]|nr:hypothetical protein [Nocardioides sp.]